MNYPNAKIYQLSYEGTPFYIGSTKKRLCDRKAEHHQDFKKCRFPHRYTLVKDWKQVEITLLEQPICCTKEDLLRVERKYILDHKPIGNKYIPLRTMKEWYEDHREERKKQMREYYHRKKNEPILD